jgi:uncharacterized membrane protein YhhN
MPKPKQQILLLLFLLCSSANLIAMTTPTALDNYLTKPFLMIFLAAYAYYRMQPEIPLSGKLLLTGLFFSFGGDTLLMFADGRPSGGNFFILGLCSFLLTHLAYWFAFFKWPQRSTSFRARYGYLALILPLAAYWAVMIYLLVPGLPAAMTVPVIVYSLVIIWMAAGALDLSPGLRPAPGRMLVIGAILFVLSDSIIAFSRFTDYLRFSDLTIGWAIMLTYLAGQFLIVEAVTRSLQSRFAGP